MHVEQEAPPTEQVPVLILQNPLLYVLEGHVALRHEEHVATARTEGVTKVAPLAKTRLSALLICPAATILEVVTAEK